MQNVPVNRPEFVYIKTAARPVIVTVEGQAIAMEAGEKRRFPSAVAEMTIYNPDTRPLLVVLVVGVGDYEKLIVSGEMVNAGGVKRANGTFVTDRRYWLPLSLHVSDNYTPEFWSFGDYAKREDSGQPMEYGDSFSSGPLYEGTILIPDSGGYQQYLRMNPEDWSVVQSGFYVKESGDGYNASHMAWGGDYFWGAVTSGRIMRKAAAGADFSVVKVVGQQIAQIGASDAAKLVAVRLYGADTIRIYHSETLDFIKDIAVTGDIMNTSQKETILIEHDEADGVDRLWLLAANGAGTVGQWVYNIETGALIDSSIKSGLTVDYVGNFRFGGIYGDWVITVDSQGGHAKNQQAYKFANREIDRRAKGGATLSSTTGPTRGTRCPRLLKPTSYINYITEADVTVDHATDTMSGEIIKAALEMYLDQELADDYLDHVFGIRVYDPGADVPWPYREILTGGKSFLLALQADNFSTKYPARLDLLIDEGVINTEIP